MASTARPGRAKTGEPDRNAYPGGPKVVVCLRCPTRFRSKSKTNRVCWKCRGEIVRQDGGVAMHGIVKLSRSVGGGE